MVIKKAARRAANTRAGKHGANHAHCKLHAAMRRLKEKGDLHAQTPRHFPQKAHPPDQLPDDRASRRIPVRTRRSALRGAQDDRHDPRRGACAPVAGQARGSIHTARRQLPQGEGRSRQEGQRDGGGLPRT